MAIDVRLDTAELDRIAAQLGIKAEAVGLRFAHDVQALAGQLAPYDTGALSNSIAVVSRSEDGNGAAQSAAAAMNPNVETESIPAPTEPTVFAHVGPCVNYGIFQELGTSKMAARPFLTPATEQLRSRYNSGEEWRSLVE